MSTPKAAIEEDDIYRHRLGLACIALADVPPATRERLSNWVDRLTNEAFQLSKRAVWWQSRSELDYQRPVIAAAARLNGRIGGLTEVPDISRVSESSWEYWEGPMRPQKFLKWLQSEECGVVAELWFKTLGVAEFAPRLDTLVKKIASHSPGCRFEIQRLAELGAAAATLDTIAVLLGFLTSDDVSERATKDAIVALGRMNEAAARPQVLGALVQVLKSDWSMETRREAATALGRMGESAATPEVT
jgi:HEAT repeat protein